MFTKRILCALMCAMVLVTVVVPALALAGTKYTNVDLNEIGVHVSCTSTVNPLQAVGTIALTYLPDPSNHMPSSDYTCRAWVDVDDAAGNGVHSHPSYVVGMGTTTIRKYSKTLDAAIATYQYWVNGNHWNTTVYIP